MLVLHYPLSLLLSVTLLPHPIMVFSYRNILLFIYLHVQYLIGLGCSRVDSWWYRVRHPME